jgi:Fibronectin type III domain
MLINLLFNRHDGSYMFFALEPNARYEARVQARNEHGWGKFSELFIFSTRATGNKISKNKKEKIS